MDRQEAQELHDEGSAERLRGSSNVLSGALRFTASLLGLLPLAYLYGFQKTLSYLHVFHADWLVYTVSPSYLLQNGAATFMATVYLVGALLWEAARYPPLKLDAHGELSRKAQITNNVLSIVLFALIFMAYFATEFDIFKNAVAAFLVGKIAGYLVWAYGVVGIWAVILDIREHNGRVSARVAAIVLPALMWLSFAPGLVGKAEGRLQSSPDSTLPRVTLRDGSEGRLLYASESHLYLFDSVSGKVRIVTSEGAIVAAAESPKRRP